MKILTEEPPFSDVASVVELITRIMQLNMPDVDSSPQFDNLAALKPLVKRCWAKIPKERPTMRECVEQLEIALRR